MELTWLEDYLALAETLNFSKAAQARHVTQPAFSRRIRALEDWIGAALFTRTTHGVSLTPAGQHFRAHAEVMTRTLHQLRRDTLAAAGRDAGYLSIAATHALSFTFFPAWVRANETILGLGHLNLVSDSMHACEQMMLRGDVSFLLCHHHSDMMSRLDPEQFKSIVVGSDALMLLSAADAKGRPRWTLRPNKPTPYLGYSEQSGLGRIIATHKATTRGHTGKLRKAFTSHLAATLHSMVRAGDGVAWLPRTLAHDDIAAGRLVEAGGANSPIAIDVRLFRPIARQRPAIEAAWSALARR